MATKSLTYQKFILFIVFFLIISTTAYACVSFETVKFNPCGQGTILQARPDAIGLFDKDTLKEYNLDSTHLEIKGGLSITFGPNEKENCAEATEVFRNSYECMTRDLYIDHLFGCYDSEEKYHQIELTDEDAKIVADFFLNGYSVLRQDSEENRAFMAKAALTNLNPLARYQYTAVTNIDGWTGYVKQDRFATFRDLSPVSTLSFCGGGSPPKIVWNNLKIGPTYSNVLLVIIIGGLATSLILRAKKKKDKNPPV